MSEFKIITHSNAKTGGYGEYSLNAGIGCTHQCPYCYASFAVHRHKDSFHSMCTPKKDLEKKLEADCQKLVKENFRGRILLSHVTDPYQPEEVDAGRTRACITILNKYGINFQVLTKGGTRACRDFDLYMPGDSFAITLTTLDEEKASIWEPFAANPIDRIVALVNAQELGIDTWVSLEPVIWPDDTLDIIIGCMDYAGHFKIGPINHNKKLRDTVDWNKFAADVPKTINGRVPFYFNRSMQRLLQK